jgi:hypothetical protein
MGVSRTGVSRTGVSTEAREAGVGPKGPNRPRRFAGAVIAAGVLLAAGALLSPAVAASRVPAQVPAHRSGSGGVFQPVAGESVPVHGGTVSSLNWSGYAVDPGSGVTAVAGSFVVPSASLLPPGFTATWAGIGGYTTSDLIQAGVGEQSLPSAPLLGPQYYAWYETLPAAETPLTNCSGDPNCTVNPGDSVTVDISNAGGNNWKISMTDANHWTWSTNVTYASSESSAEWILEAPTLVAAQTIPAPGGAADTIAQGNPIQIDMGLGVGPNEATPSALGSDGQSFNDCTYASSCPAP